MARDLSQSNPLQSRHVRCPRCGYDQRGVITTWTKECPLSGTCTECGLEFAWRELLNPRLTIPKWFVEADRSWRQFAWQCLGTFMRSLQPWKFWSSVHMSHPQNARRAVLYGIICFGALYVCFAVSHGLLVWGNWYEMASDSRFIPSTGGWLVFLHAAILPMSNQSIGQFATSVGSMMPYMPPVSAMSFWKEGAPTMMFTFLWQTVCGVAFALLPISRRRAHVQWSHIIRVTWYGYFLVMPAIAATIISVGLTVGGFAQQPEYLAVMAAILWLLWPVMLVVWWSLATSRYLRMPHAWGVGLSVVVIGLLTPLAVIVAVNAFLPKS